MAQLFISHSSRDNPHALALHAWLVESGWPPAFLDISVEDGLAPGQRWQDELTAAADRCEAVIALISPEWCRSQWCIAELSWARKLRKDIFGVLVKPTPTEVLPAILAAEWQLCDLTQGAAWRTFKVESLAGDATEVSFPEEGLRRLRVGLTKSGLDPRHFAWPPASDPLRSPYPGLRALDVDDAAVFFGREADIVRGIGALRDVRERGAEKIFAVVGASGAGKSSLLRAGLWPRLERDDANFLPLRVLRPNGGVIEGPNGLVAALEDAFRRQGRPTTRAALRQAIATPESLQGLLLALQRLRHRAGSAAPTLVLVVDQAEELFASEQPVQYEAFLSLLGGMLGASPDPAPRLVLVVLGIRADAYARLQDEARLRSVRSFLFDLRTVPPGAYQAVIEGPAARSTAAGHKLRIAPELTNALLADTQGTDALPLLAFTLERLLVEYGASGELTLADYRELGGLRGALVAAVEAAFREPSRAPAVPADEVEREALLREGFIPFLAGFDPATGAPRRRVSAWSAIPQRAWPVLERLVDQRLLVRTRSEAEGSPPETVVEVAHEALLRQWPALAGWLEEEAVALKTLDALRLAAADWRANGGDDPWLVHTGTRRPAAEALAARPGFTTLLGAQGHAYVEACIARDEKVRRQRAIELAHDLVHAAERANDAGQHDRTMRLAILAARECDEPTAREAAELELLRGTQACALSLTISVGQAPVSAIAWSPDGLLIAAAASGAGVGVWSTVDGRLVARYLGHVGAVRSLAWQPGGSVVASLSEAGEAQLWEALDGRLVFEFSRPGTLACALAFSAQGTCFVVASDDGIGQIRSTSDGRLLATLAGRHGAMTCAVFASDDASVFTGSAMGRVCRWSPAGELQAELLALPNPVRGLACDPHGKRLLARDDAQVTLFDLEAGQELATWDHARASFSADGQLVLIARRSVAGAQLHGSREGRPRASFDAHDSPLHCAVPSPAGSSVLLFYRDRTATVASALTGRTTRRLIGQDSEPTLARFSPNGSRAATGGHDGVLRIWNILDPDAQGEPGTSATRAANTEAPDPITAQAQAQTRQDRVREGLAKASPEAEREVLAVGPRDSAATGSKDGSILLWDTATLTRTGLLTGHEGPVLSIAFSQDGQWLLSASWDGTARLWNLRSQTTARVFRHEARSVHVARFGFDDKLVFTASTDGSVQVRDIATGRALAEFRLASGPVLDIDLSPDGQWLRAFSADRVQGRRIATLSHCRGAELVAHAAAFHMRGAGRLTADDVRAAPFLRGREGEDILLDRARPQP